MDIQETMLRNNKGCRNYWLNRIMLTTSKSMGMLLIIQYRIFKMNLLPIMIMRIPPCPSPNNQNTVKDIVIDNNRLVKNLDRGFKE